MIFNLLKRPFPWEVLTIRDATISSSLVYNPYSDAPPRHRYELGVGFNAFALDGSKAYAPFITYTFDLNQRDWVQLPGTHRLYSSCGSDLWHNDDNLGPVYLRRIEIRKDCPRSFAVSLDLRFYFAQSVYRRQSKVFRCSVRYEGLSFFVPIWSKPRDVSFPASWRIPSTDPHWTDEQIRAFLEIYVDLSHYTDLEIDHSSGQSVAKAMPKEPQ